MTHPAVAQKAGIGAWEDSRNMTLEWIERTPALGWYYNWRADQMWHEKKARAFRGICADDPRCW